MKVRNATGVSFAAKSTLALTGWDATNNAMKAVLADVNSLALYPTFMNQDAIPDGSVGDAFQIMIVAMDTAGKTVGDAVYASKTTPGAITVTDPADAAVDTIQVGMVTVVGTDGRVLVDLATFGKAIARGSSGAAAQSVTTTMLKDASVTTAKVVDGNVTEPKMAAADGNTKNVQRIAKAKYDFAVNGGAISTITLTGEALPANAVVTRAYFRVLTPLASGGAAHIAIQIEAAGDLVADQALGGPPNFTAAAMAEGKPDGTMAKAIPLTSSKSAKMVVSAFTLTAGKFDLWMEYVVSD